MKLNNSYRLFFLLAGILLMLGGCRPKVLVFEDVSRSRTADAAQEQEKSGQKALTGQTKTGSTGSAHTNDNRTGSTGSVNTGDNKTGRSDPASVTNNEPDHTGTSSDSNNEAGNTGTSSDSNNEAGNVVESEAQIAVFVCGAVKNPGVFYLAEGSRVVKAVEAAGGFIGEADPDWINLARPLTDGEQICFLTKEEVREQKEKGICFAAPAGAAGENASRSDLQHPNAENPGAEDPNTENLSGTVNLNTADKKELMTLPGIGEVRAESILSYREMSGGFAYPEQICEVSGIGEAVYEKIRDRISVQ